MSLSVPFTPEGFSFCYSGHLRNEGIRLLLLIAFAKSKASFFVKLAVICAEPADISSLMRGAVITRLPEVIAI
jgi:hypothetical protein